MKKNGFLYLFMVIFFVTISLSGFSQIISGNNDLPSSVTDSLRKNGIIFDHQRQKPEISLSTKQAIDFLQHRYQLRYWKNPHDPLRQAIGQLVFEASHQPYDSSEVFLKNYPFDSLDVPWDKFFIWEPLRLKIPVISHPSAPLPVDSLFIADTNKISAVADTGVIIELKIPESVSRTRPVAGLKDTSILVVIDTLHHVSSEYPGFPFTYYNYPYQADSIQMAVKSLMEFLEARDSSIINITGINNVVTPVWLNSKSGRMHRYWLRNDLNDSVTVWIGATSRNTLGLYLENGVVLRRPSIQANYSQAYIEMKEIDNSKLLNVKKIVVKPQYWKYRAEADFALSQTSLTNWVKGGESSVSTSMDITGYADYNNKSMKLSSNNFIRLKFGMIAINNKPDWEVRKNLDLLETNSKLNHKAFGKFDFSAILLFKTQIARGYNYPNDSIPVSKFMSPAILTAGIGLDYKPNKTTSINFSPFSYKGTFVLDTAIVDRTRGIDQTKYGIAADKKAKNEPGASFMISNEFKPIKSVTITNRLQLFTNYIHNPQNVDVDWEMILTASLNWFTDVRFNTHLIFDDDTKTPVFDKENKPVLGLDGIQKKNARVQFKELLGFSFVFRF
jgi:hypothetical protein